MPLETILYLLLIAWFLSMVSAYTLGGYIHFLLILAFATALIRVFQRRKANRNIRHRH